MASLFYPNLMFEEQLSGQSTGSLRAQQYVADLAPLMGLLAETSDDAVLVAAESQPDELPDALQGRRFVTPARLSRSGSDFAALIPWGVSPQSRDFARQFDLPPPGCSEESVVRVNSRRFQSEFDVSSDGTPASGTNIPFSTICGSVHEVQLWLDQNAAPARPWVMKAEFSQAARSRVLGKGPRLDSAAENWLRRRLASGQIVAMEPWVHRLAEFGLQLEIIPAEPRPPETQPPKTPREPVTLPHANVQFLGALQMLNSPQGQYRGSLLHCGQVADDVWRPAKQHALMIAAQAAAAGYWGPLGIDCMWHTDSESQPRLRMAHDLNGRYTMGRLALKLADRLESGHSGAWLHLSQNVAQGREFLLARSLSASVSVCSTSPGKIGGRQPQVSTWLLASHDRETLLDAVSVCTDALNC